MKSSFISDLLAVVSGASAVSVWSIFDKVDVLLRITVSVIGIVAGLVALRQRLKAK